MKFYMDGVNIYSAWFLDITISTCSVKQTVIVVT